MDNIKRGYRKAVFIVVYRFNKKVNKREYILLKRKKHWKGWEFPKGGVENNESDKAAARREVREETGLKAKNILMFNVKGKYNYKRIFSDRPGYIGQTYRLFSAQVEENQKVRIDTNEHSGYIWLEFEKAIKKLRFSNQKKCLSIVEKSLYKVNSR